jgi:hypothetical protein
MALHILAYNLTRVMKRRHHPAPHSHQGMRLTTALGSVWTRATRGIGRLRRVRCASTGSAYSVDPVIGQYQKIAVSWVCAAVPNAKAAASNPAGCDTAFRSSERPMKYNTDKVSKFRRVFALSVRASRLFRSAIKDNNEKCVPAIRRRRILKRAAPCGANCEKEDTEIALLAGDLTGGSDVRDCRHSAEQRIRS